jgi:hypothetical protein
VLALWRRGCDRLTAVRRRHARICRRLQNADRAQRPVAQERPADYVVRADLADLVRARVGRVVAVVAHHEQPAGLNNPRRLFVEWVRRRAVDVRLVDPLAVDEHVAAVERHRVARLADHALDVRRRRWSLGVLNRVRARAFAYDRSEDDDVPTRVRVEARCELVDENVLVGQQRYFHALLLDAVGLGNEALDEPEDDDGQDEGLGNLDETAQRLAAHRRRSVDAAGVLGVV